MFTKANKQTVRRGRRSLQYRLPLSADRDLRVSVRWFKTNKATRSRTRQQYVVRLPGLPVKELCFSLQNRRKRYTTILGFRISSAALIILGLSGGFYSSQHLSKAVALEPVATKPAAQTSQTLSPLPLSRSEPTRLQIDAVSINAAITGVGLRRDKTIEVPSPKLVGWYNQGPTPGEKGPAVLVGHVDYLDGVAIFWRLREIAPGDVVKVTRADGITVSFRVDSIQQFDQDSFPTQAVYGALNYPGIRLITCGGTFDPITHHYSHNTVVFGTMINSAK